MGALAAAIRLLTVLPVPGRQSERNDIATSIAFFPLIGLGIGAAMAAVNWLAGEALPLYPAAALALATGVVLTGALHLDGLADTFDGLLGGGNPERRLQIMRDASIGVFGITAVIMVLAVKWSSLASLGIGTGWAAVILGPAFGRLAAAWVISRHRYTRAEGMGEPYRRGVGLPLLFALLVAAGAAVGLLGPWALLPLVVALCVGELVAKFAAARLDGGVTGDVYGACIELAEAASLIWLLALTRSDLHVGFPLGG